MTTNNPFDAWVKGKVVALPCGCRTEHGQDPVGGQVVFCEKHSWEIEYGAEWPTAGKNVRRVDKQKAAPLTLAKIRRVVKKLRVMAEKTKLPCGCTPYLVAKMRLILVTADECRKHNDEQF